MPGWLLTPLKKLFGDDFGLGPSSVNIILWILRGCFGAIMRAGASSALHFACALRLDRASSDFR